MVAARRCLTDLILQVVGLVPVGAIPAAVVPRKLLRFSGKGTGALKGAELERRPMVIERAGRMERIDCHSAYGIDRQGLPPVDQVSQGLVERDRFPDVSQHPASSRDQVDSTKLTGGLPGHLSQQHLAAAGLA